MTPNGCPTRPTSDAPQSVGPNGISSIPGASASTRFLLRAKDSAKSQDRPAGSWNGVPRSCTSNPLLVMAAVCAAESADDVTTGSRTSEDRSWYIPKSRPRRRLAPISSAPSSSPVVCSGPESESASTPTVVAVGDPRWTYVCASMRSVSSLPARQRSTRSRALPSPKVCRIATSFAAASYATETDGNTAVL